MPKGALAPLLLLPVLVFGQPSEHGPDSGVSLHSSLDHGGWRPTRGEETLLRVELKSRRDRALDLSLTAETDDERWIDVSGVPSSFRLPPNATLTLSLPARAPSDAEPGTRRTARLQVETDEGKASLELAVSPVDGRPRPKPRRLPRPPASPAFELRAPARIAAWPGADLPQSLVLSNRAAEAVDLRLSAEASDPTWTRIDALPERLELPARSELSMLLPLSVPKSAALKDEWTLDVSVYGFGEEKTSRSTLFVTDEREQLLCGTESMILARVRRNRGQAASKPALAKVTSVEATAQGLMAAGVAGRELSIGSGGAVRAGASAVLRLPEGCETAARKAAADGVGLYVYGEPTGAAGGRTGPQYLVILPGSKCEAR